MKIKIIIVWALLCAVFASPHLIQMAQAATWTVNSLDDSSDGACNATNCTLREAITAANAAADADLIDFSSGVTGTLMLSSALPALNTDISIQGPGAEVLAISGTETPDFYTSWRIFNVTGGTVVISGLTIKKGYANGNGGGVLNSGTLTVENCVFSNNFASQGGAICNIGTLTVSDCSLINNSAGRGGGIANISNMSGSVRGFATVNRCVFSGNAAVTTDNQGNSYSGEGGGLYTTGSLTVNASTIKSSSAEHGGGAYSRYGVLNLFDSTLNNNSAGAGGGVYCINDNLTASPGTTWITTMRNCTLSANAAFNGSGFYSATGLSIIESCTITKSTTMYNGSGGGLVSEIYENKPTETKVRHTLIAGNLNDDVRGVGFVSQGYNLVGYGNANSFFNQPGDKIVADARLRHLADNGGPTQTHALLPDSPAFNAGDPNFAPPPDFDQRGAGFPRVQGGRLDIGAFELDSAQSGSNLQVNKTDDHNDGTCGTNDCTLREAINAAGGAGVTPTITFAPNVTGTIQLFSALPVLRTNLALQGPGAAVLTVRGEGSAKNYEVFEVGDNITVTISGLTISNGSALGANYGGGIYNRGQLTVQNCVLSDNVATYGGGIANSGFASPTLRVTNCTFRNNNAAFGGAIYNVRALTIENCTFSSNNGRFGAGLYNATDTATISTTNNSTFSGNHALDNDIGRGGAIFHNSGQLNLSNCTIANNSASINGGGIYNNNPLQIGNSILSANTSDTEPNLANTSNGSVTSNGYNISSDDLSAFLVEPTDKNNTNPLIGPLANNGGPTQTHALLVGSPAINAGNTALTTDQRGIARPQGGADDIGAYEDTTFISINDVTVTEGNPAQGAPSTVNAVFTVTLSQADTQTVTVNFATANGTAVQPADYTATSGTLTFNPGETSKTVTVAITGDTNFENNETFTLVLSNATNATIADDQGIGTITNDDADTTAPTVSFTTSATNPSGTTPVNGSTISGAMPTITGVAADSGSGVAKVELRLHRVVNSITQFWSGTEWGTTQVKLAATLNPTSGGANVSWSKGAGWPTGSNLTDGTYYLTAYATDKANKIASVSSNFKVFSDTTAPTVRFTTSATTPVGTTPVNGSTIYNAMPAITGEAADNGSGVAKVELRLHRVVNSVVEFWSGTAWGAAQVRLTATLNPATGGANVIWSKGAGWPTGGNLSENIYYLTAYATDKAAKVASTSCNFKVLSDTVVPTVSFTTASTTPVGTTPVSGSTIYNAMPTITGVAADSGSGVAKVELRLHRVLNSVVEFWNGTSWGTTQVKLAAVLNPTSGGANVSWSKGSGWPGGANLSDNTYYLTAYAYDKAGKVASASSNFKKATNASGSTSGSEMLSASDVRFSAGEAWVSNQSIRLSFSGALEQVTAENRANYHVSISTPVSISQAVTVKSASYDKATRTITLLLAEGSLEAGNTVSVKWSLRDGSGAPLNGQAELQAQ
jgi:CSLREA domain-containing protein